MILEIIMKKSGSSFDIFCDAIKFKYKGIYNLLTDAKKAPIAQEKPG